MLKLSLLFASLLIVMVTSASWAENAPELLDQLNDDPSLLLDPNLTLEPTPTPAPASATPLIERVPSSTAEVKEAISETKKEPEAAPVEEAAPAPTKALHGMPSFLKSQKGELKTAAPEKKNEPEASLLEAAPASPTLLPPSMPTPQPVAEGHGPVPQTAELVALPGVVDFSVILSGSQFYPSRIRMKSSPKSRIIFTSTGRKPAALVFEKLQINRWIAGEAEKPAEGSARPSKIEEYRELSTSRVTEISFEANPGKYQFYDALSGAAGEIIVD
jgi:hypothetical protein